MNTLRSTDLLPLGIEPDKVRALREAVMRAHPGGGQIAGFCICGGQGRGGPACAALRQLQEAAETVRELMAAPKVKP